MWLIFFYTRGFNVLRSHQTSRRKNREVVLYQAPLSQERRQAITFYGVQLFVNFLLPIVFCRFERYWLSVAVILILVVLVAMTTLRFWKLNKTAGYLMLPYLLWLLFATYLNIGVGSVELMQALGASKACFFN
jgi:tryptophan-rich sensory protein